MDIQPKLARMFKTIEQLTKMIGFHLQQCEPEVRRALSIPEKIESDAQAGKLMNELLGLIKEKQPRAKELIEQSANGQIRPAEASEKCYMLIEKDLNEKLGTFSSRVTVMGSYVSQSRTSSLPGNINVENEISSAKKTNVQLARYYKREYPYLLIAGVSFLVLSILSSKQQVASENERLSKTLRQVNKPFAFLSEYRTPLHQILLRQQDRTRDHQTRIIQFFQKLCEKFFQQRLVTHISPHGKGNKSGVFLLPALDIEALESLKADALLVIAEIEGSFAEIELFLYGMESEVNSDPVLKKLLTTDLGEDYSSLVIIREIYEKELQLLGTPRIYENFQKMKELQKACLFFKHNQQNKKILGLAGMSEVDFFVKRGHLEQMNDYIKSKSTHEYLEPISEFFDGVIDSLKEQKKEMENNEF